MEARDGSPCRLSFQPSELVKLLIIFYASDYVTRKLSLKNKIRESFLPITLVLSIISVLYYNNQTLAPLCYYFNYIWNFFLELNFNKFY